MGLAVADTAAADAAASPELALSVATGEAGLTTGLAGLVTACGVAAEVSTGELGVPAEVADGVGPAESVPELEPVDAGVDTGLFMTGYPG